MLFQLKNTSIHSKVGSYLLLAPALLLIAIFKYYPIVIAGKESFFQINYLSSKTKFIGLKNYIDLFSSILFWEYLWVTIKLNILITPIQIFISFIMALLVNQKYYLTRLFRILFFIPLGVSLPLAVIYMSLFFQPSSGGFINQLLLSFGFSSQDFYLSASEAPWIIIFIASWKGCSFWMLFLLAGLQDIDTCVMEAAYIDGANLWTRILRIVIPLIKRPILFVLSADTAINFTLFVPIFILTKGGPDGATNVLMYEAYKAMLSGNFGHATAITAILSILLSIILLLQFIFLKAERN